MWRADPQQKEKRKLPALPVFGCGTALHFFKHLIKITCIINPTQVRNLLNRRTAVPKQLFGIIDLFRQNVLDDRCSELFFKFP